MSGAPGEMRTAPRKRKSGLTTLDLYRLEQACKPVWDGFGWGRSGSTYLVGTAQTGGEYRDVDVRTILPDEKYQGNRNPVGHGHREYAGGGDATKFDLDASGRPQGSTDG